MSRETDEKVVKEIIEYANGEITKSKKKHIKIIISILVSLVLLATAFFFVFVFEIPVPYSEDMLDAQIAVDTCLDIKINLPNYKTAKSVLVKVDDNSYDLYINVTQTLATKIIEDNDKSNNMITVGNRMVGDFQSESIHGYLPDGYDTENIKNIYYIDNLSKKNMTLDDSELIAYENKILVWTRQ